MLSFVFAEHFGPFHCLLHFPCNSAFCCGTENTNCCRFVHEEFVLLTEYNIWAAKLFVAQFLFRAPHIFRRRRQIRTVGEPVEHKHTVPVKQCCCKSCRRTSGIILPKNPRTSKMYVILTVSHLSINVISPHTEVMLWKLTPSHSIKPSLLSGMVFLLSAS